MGASQSLVNSIPIVDDTFYFKYRSHKNLPGTDLEASSLRTNLYSAGSSHARCQGEKQLIVLSSCKAYEPQ